MLTRLALYTALGLTLNALEQSVASVGFWCVVGLFWAAEHLTRVETIETIAEEVERLRAERKENNK